MIVVREQENAKEGWEGKKGLKGPDVAFTLELTKPVTSGERNSK